ncbi:MAG TPA: hypothetical protein VFP70_15430 [Burkholderiales bacterium]|nr:hypothetical protein [Burkholderiales bacterium]
MSAARKPLYERLPEIYRIRDAEQSPPGQLQAFVGVLDEVMSALRGDIEGLYHNLFIETCDDWVVPYIADLLGTSHLKGDPWTLRADVARTVHHRRRKGTLGAVESLVFALSGWAAHGMEMRERLAWNQHMNHQRPDAGGVPPLALARSVSGPVRGGTVNLRDPAQLSLLNGAFDPFAHVVDTKPPGPGHNLPNLAVFLWRLKDYQVPSAKPLARGPVQSLAGAAPDEASFAVRFDVHPLGDALALFNRHRFHADDDPPDLSLLDAVPGPIPRARLTQGTPAGNPAAYVQVKFHASVPPPEFSNVGLTFHLPDVTALNSRDWRFRGANLCAWEAGLRPKLRAYEIVVDPERGRVVFGLRNNASEAALVREKLLVTHSYGASGPTGAHPVQRTDPGTGWQRVTVNGHIQDPATALQHALDDIQNAPGPVLIEIADSLTHDLDLAAVLGVGDEAGRKTLRLNHDLWIRAASGRRPVIRLARPLGFRPDNVLGSGAAALMARLTVRLEGLYLARGEGFTGNALIEQAAVNRLDLDGCTLDPGGALGLDGVRRPALASLRLANDHGFANAPERQAFDQLPRVVLHRSVCGPLLMDDQYLLYVSGSIVDAGSGVDAPAPALAIRGASGDPEATWGPRLALCEPPRAETEPGRQDDPCKGGSGGGLTCFGRARVQSATGSGGIFVHRLEVHDTLHGCLRFGWFPGKGNRLPQHHGCVFGLPLRFEAEAFGSPAYGQLRRDCDRHVLEQGPGGDEMGAFGYLANTHKWKNISIRSREFMPAGVRPVLLPIT